VNGEKPRGLVPPQPNLGPEPWQEPDATTPLLLALGIAAVILLLAAWGWRRRSTRQSRRLSAVAGGPAVADLTPRDRLVALSETLRDALTARFGSSFRAKTTEELADDERLVEQLDTDGFRELMQFLDRIDRLKFASERSEDQDDELGEALKSWEPRVTALAARIRARPNPRTRPAAARPRPVAPTASRVAAPLAAKHR
jgi:hypothetical protein